MRALLLISLALALAACGTPADPVDTGLVAFSPPDADGPHAVGVTTITLTGVADYDEIPVEVWYPTAEPSDRPSFYDFIGLEFPAAATRNAPPDPSAPNLVVVFSHGLGGLRVQNYTMAERLASHGFVVVSADHPGTTTLEFIAGFDDLGADLVRRPATVAAAVDAVRDGAIPGLAANADRYALIGHSLGAWTALAVGGATLSSDAYQSACTGRPRPTGCAVIGPITYSDADLAAYGQPDPRVVTTILQNPGGFYSFEEGTLAQVVRPLVMAGPLDTTLPFEAEALATFERLSPDAELVVFDRSGHYGCSNMCDLPIATTFAPDCEGEPAGFADPAVVLEDTVRTVVAWVGATLGEQPAYETWLTDAPGVAWGVPDPL